MPTIRRTPTPSWRPRKMFGYALESLISRNIIDLECDRWFHESDLSDRARELILQLKLTTWFIRVPGEKKHFATLMEWDGHHRPSRDLLEKEKYLPLTPDPSKLEHPHYQYLSSSRYHISFVAGKAKIYPNGNPEFCWDAVRDYLELMEHPPEDRDAFKDI